MRRWCAAWGVRRGVGCGDGGGGVVAGVGVRWVGRGGVWWERVEMREETGGRGGGGWLANNANANGPLTSGPQINKVVEGPGS